MHGTGPLLLCGCVLAENIIAIGKRHALRQPVCMQGGILSIDVAQDNENLLATGGADSVVVLFDREASRIRASLTGHTKKINSAPSFVFSTKHMVLYIEVHAPVSFTRISVFNINVGSAVTVRRLASCKHCFAPFIMLGYLLHARKC